jgi:hypothetical protein
MAKQQNSRATIDTQHILILSLLMHHFLPLNILLMIEYHNSIRQHSFLHRNGLMRAQLSSCQQLLQNGITRCAFFLLQQALFSKDELHNMQLGKRKRGRPQLLNPADQ